MAAAINSTVKLCGWRKGTDEGEPCKLPARPGRNRCRFHGGSVPMGATNGQFKHGRYSKLLPEGLRTRYDEAFTDESLMSLRGEVSLIDVRLSHLVERLSSRASGAIFEDISDAWKKFREANNNKNAEKMLHYANVLQTLIQQGASEESQWRELIEIMHDKSALVKAEAQRQKDMQTMITTESAMVLFAALVDIIRRHVTHPQTLRLMTDEINALQYHGSNRIKPDVLCVSDEEQPEDLIQDEPEHGSEAQAEQE